MLYISKIHVKIVLQTKLLRHSFLLHWHRIGTYLVYVLCSEENYQKVSIYITAFLNLKVHFSETSKI